MLDVIGAGATASSSVDWHDVWKKSAEAGQVQQQIETLHTEGRSRPAVTTALGSEFATPWLYQLKELTKRTAQCHWRNPTYLLAKLALNALGGLMIGFTFFKSENTLRGVQNKLFVSDRFMLSIRLISPTYQPGNLHGHYHRRSVGKSAAGCVHQD